MMINDAWTAAAEADFIHSFVYSPIPIITRRTLTIVPIIAIGDSCVFYAQQANANMQ